MKNREDKQSWKEAGPRRIGAKVRKELKNGMLSCVCVCV